MAPKKNREPNPDQNQKNSKADAAYIENAGIVMEQPITETLEKNFMPYAMSVIVSRAIPEIDGFKPSQRKLLYTMYKMGLLNGPRTKSANIVGQTMRLSPHGDGPIYETMVRLARGNESLLHPYIDSKGNFGKAYSRDMAYAASRYTEAKLSPVAALLFADIDSDTVDFADNYDGTVKEPVLFPVTFPSVLVNSNIGIAVGMASSICSFNLAEVCETTEALMKNPDHDILSTLKAPDFSGGGYVVYEEDSLRKIYETGRSSVKVRARYSYDKSAGCIDITEIPPSTTVEAVIDKTVDLVKANKIREIADLRDETDLKGLKLTIDLRRGADPEKLMQKLYRMTTLEDSFSCNFNVLIAGMPRVLGVAELLNEWISFRRECVRRRVYFELSKAKDRLHLLRGLAKILLDIDKAIQIVRNTDEEAEVVPNLMIGFGIDQIQAEYVAEIKLRHLNREYILKRTEDINRLEAEIADLEDILAKKARVSQLMVADLENVIQKYAQPRRTEIVYVADMEEPEPEAEVPDYPVHLFFTREGYFKKITPQSLRMSGEQKLKDGDAITQALEASNRKELLFFTNKCQVYKSRAAEFDDTKASVLGDYVASKLEMEEGETAIYMAVLADYSGYMLFFFENGKAAKVDLEAYKTKTNRKKLIKAFSDKSPVTALFHLPEDAEFVLQASSGRYLLIHTAAISAKSTKDTLGVAAMTLKKGQRVLTVKPYAEGMFEKPQRYKTKNLPAAGASLSEADKGEQLSLL